jgi:calcineurin-like phosphoesterase family protein
MIWFTSDSHFSHTNILNLTSRHQHFKNIKEMNWMLIEKINECVGAKDTLYHLGDFYFGKGKHWVNGVNDILSQIKCQKIHLVIGNHDPTAESENLKKAKFKSVCSYLEMNIKKEPGWVQNFYAEKICLSHYPLRSWNSITPIHLHGHSHGKHGFMTSSNRAYLSFDVGVDSPGLNYSPVSLKDIVERSLKEYKTQFKHT